MFTGKEEHGISLADAKELTRKYRDQAGTGAVLGCYFSRKALQQVLDQQDCVGIRHYYGENDQGEQVLVLAGVAADGTDMTGGLLLELGIPCPPFCKSGSPLTSD